MAILDVGATSGLAGSLKLLSVAIGFAGQRREPRDIAKKKRSDEMC